MVSRLGSVGLAPAVGVVLVLAAAGCGSKVATLAQAESPIPSISSVSELGAVPWADRPGRFFEPSPLPAHPLTANARPCTASDVRVVPDGGNGGGGHSYQTFVFRNIGTTTCVLRGYPSVVASEPGKADVTAADGGFFVGRERSGNMPPGGVTALSIETERDCPARYAHPDRYPALVYRTVTVGIPGGGHVVISQRFDVLCGLYTGQFAAAQPPQQHTKSPVTGAHAALALQHRGEVLVVSLDNNDPSQVTSYGAGKDLGGLICLLRHRPWWRRMQPPGLQMLRTTQC
jgi:hypothetical protein